MEWQGVSEPSGHYGNVWIVQGSCKAGDRRMLLVKKWRKCNKSIPVAAGALDVHEVAVGVLNKALELVPPLLLVREGVQQVLSERHRDF